MRYRVCVDKDLCQGHSMCIAEAPDVFSVSDQGQIYDTVEVISEIVDGESYEKARLAMAACPNGVISLQPVEGEE
jgi:ferredoxin